MWDLPWDYLVGEDNKANNIFLNKKLLLKGKFNFLQNLPYFLFNGIILGDDSFDNNDIFLEDISFNGNNSLSDKIEANSGELEI